MKSRLHTQGSARMCGDQTRGFSLIEVLIAVLVLGVGLLGLASVFPVVISQQRDATDVIRGGAASAAIREQIRANPDIIDELLSQDGYADVDEPDLDGDRAPNDNNDSANDSNNDGIPDTFNPEVDGQEPIFGQDTDFNPNAFSTTLGQRFNPLTGYSYLWETDWDWSSTQTVTNGPNTLGIGGGENLLALYRQDGGVRFRDPDERAGGFSAATNADLPVAARLYPRPYSVEGSRQDGPQYVWDFVPRRSPNGGIQLVVFVRRISTGIRVGAGETLSSVLSNQADRVYPVSWDPTTGRTSTNGESGGGFEYAVPMSAEAFPVLKTDYPARPESRDANDPSLYLSDSVRLRVAADTEIGTAQSFEAMTPIAQVGQKFVDNLGVVRTVVEVLAVSQANQQIDLRVEPAFVPTALFPDFAAATSFSLAQDEAARIGKLRQVVYTPQIPVDVFTMEFSQ